MKNLWFSFIVIATLGSIYPFDFRGGVPDAATIDAFLASCCGSPGRGDLVANVMLFLPFGFTGFLALGGVRAPRSALFAVAVAGLLFAFALQVLQIFLPSRDENLQDVAWNLAGTVGGAAFAVGFRRFGAVPGVGHGGAALVPACLAGAWLIYRTIPFVPTLDLQSLKDSLKPLLFGGLDVVSATADVAGWLLFAWLLRGLRPDARLDRHLTALVAGVLALELLIVGNAIDRADVVGAALAALLWTFLIGRLPRPEPAILGLLLLALTLGGLAPFTLHAVPQDFNWLPFHGFLGGSMFINAQSAAEKVFLYGCLVYLLVRMSVDRTASLGLAVLFVALIEVMQKFVVGHTPESTDPLLVVFAALALFALSRQESGAPAVAPPARGRAAATNGRRPRGANRNGNGNGNGTRLWVPQRVNLLREQYELLRRIAAEMDVSVSGVTRQIVQRYIEECESQDAADVPGAAPSLTAEWSLDNGSRSARWVNHRINLKRSQHEFLTELGKEMNLSVSATTRFIVARFIDTLQRDDAREALHK